MVHSGARAKTSTPRPRTPATRPKTPSSTSPKETALTPSSNPILASKFTGITVTNADGERRSLYPSLPVPKPLAQPVSNFRIETKKPIAPPSAPIASKKKMTYSPLQSDNNDNLYNKKRVLCALFSKFAQRRMQKEADDAKAEQRAPDFHYAISVIRPRSWLKTRRSDNSEFNRTETWRKTTCLSKFSSIFS